MPDKSLPGTQLPQQIESDDAARGLDRLEPAPMKDTLPNLDADQSRPAGGKGHLVAGPPSRRWWWLAVVVIAVGIGILLMRRDRLTASTQAPPGSASASAQSSRRSAGGAVQPVSVATAEKRDIRVTVNAIGSIAALNTAVVHARVDGELKAIYFTEGKPVRAGQLLVQIDPQPFQIALALAQGTLARDQAQLRNAQLDLLRYRDLLAKDAAPKQQFDTQEALVQQLQGTVLSDQATVDNAKLQLTYTRIVAPISGLAGLRLVDLGNMVHAADAGGVLSIAQTQPVSVVFAVPDANLPRIRQQLKAGAVLRVEAWDRDQKTLLAEGSVASTDNAIDPATGTIRVKAQFPNLDGSLFPNQFVNVRLQLDMLIGATAVHSAAIQRGTFGSFVYAVDDDNNVTLRRVSAGAIDGDWVAVQGQLKPGDRVVTDGADRLRDGSKVQVIAPSASAAARPPTGKTSGSGGKQHLPASATEAASQATKPAQAP